MTFFEVRAIHLVPTQHFPKNQYFLPPDTHTYVYVSGGKRYQFIRNFGVRTKQMIPLAKWFQKRFGPRSFYCTKNGRVLARPYFMTLYVIFPIHLNFPVRSRCVLKAIIHRRKQWIVLLLLEKVLLFQKDAFYSNAHACGI